MRYDLLLGHRVAVVKTAPLNVFGTTSWRAPGLDFERLQYRVETFKAGAVRVMSEQRAVSLQLKEPDAKLFDESGNYAELRPSEVLRKEAQMQKEAETADKRYSQLQKPATAPRQ